MATKRQTIIAAAEQKGCLGKAHLDEPLFILRAKDKLASRIVRHWVQVARDEGVHRDKVQEAYQLAAEMDEWAVGNGNKTPD